MACHSLSGEGPRGDEDGKGFKVKKNNKLILVQPQEDGERLLKDG
jgi:hypothetical protein